MSRLTPLTLFSISDHFFLEITKAALYIDI